MSRVSNDTSETPEISSSKEDPFTQSMVRQRNRLACCERNVNPHLMNIDMLYRGCLNEHEMGEFPVLRSSSRVGSRLGLLVGCK